MVAAGPVLCSDWSSEPLCIYTYSYILEKRRLPFLFLEKPDLLLTGGAVLIHAKSISGRYLGNR